MRPLILVATICFFIASSAFGVLAQQPGETPNPQTSATESKATSADAPVMAPEPTEMALAYHRSGLIIWGFMTLWGWLIPALVLISGFSARIRDWAKRIATIPFALFPTSIHNWGERMGLIWFLTIGFYFAIFTIGAFLIDLPLSYYLGYVRQHSYGLSNQTLGKWFQDEMISLGIGIALWFLFLWAPYLLLKRSPRRWWLYTGLLAIPILLFVVLIQPVFIDPLYNKFGPLKNKQLEAKILMLAGRAGIEGGRVYEVEKSEDTKLLNAYVTGFGNTKRIVLWDTLIKKMDEDEVLSVMSHEIGHYALDHIWKRIFFFSLLIIITLYLIHRTAGWAINKFRDRFGFSELSDVASFPLLILLYSLFVFLIYPVGLAFTRYQEREADRFGLEINQNNHAAATSLVKLQAENLGIPRPHFLRKLWHASHPPLGERIDFSNQYQPWKKGIPLKYGHLFKTPANQGKMKKEE